MAIVQISLYYNLDLNEALMQDLRSGEKITKLQYRVHLQRLSAPYVVFIN